MIYPRSTVLAIFAIASVVYAAALPSPTHLESLEPDSHVGLELDLKNLTKRSASPEPGKYDKKCPRDVVDKLVFEASMEDFQKARRAKDPPGCIWSSDDCSKAPERFIGVDFAPSCQRHDFGYRNTKEQRRFRKMKRRMDKKFKNDLHRACKAAPGWLCKAGAIAYYLAARVFGNRLRLV